MQDKLQELTDRLYNEGLSKGKQDGEELLQKAQAEADRIVTYLLSKNSPFC
jgi:V/A-type H+-transporting ATPase subunit E